MTVVKHKIALDVMPGDRVVLERSSARGTFPKVLVVEAIRWRPAEGAVWLYGAASQGLVNYAAREYHFGSRATVYVDAEGDQ